MSTHLVRTIGEIGALEERVRTAAEAIPAMLSAHPGPGLALLHDLKFGSAGRHPVKDAQGFQLVLGPHRGESLKCGLVAAEVFAAVSTDSNDKLKKDAAKMAANRAVHR